MMPFVVLEGCDGSGKTTLREILRLQLEALGIPTVTVGQHSWLHPWHSRTLIAAREQRRAVSAPALTEAYLQDKHLHGRRNVRPALTKAVVIADRWFYSDAVYHAALYGIPPEQTLELHRGASTEVPNILVYVQTDPDEAYARIQKRGKHARHYERPADLRRIVEVYEHVFGGGLVSAQKLVRVSNANGLDDLQALASAVLVPEIQKWTKGAMI